jgi:streptomycin 6-kinase
VQIPAALARGAGASAAGAAWIERLPELVQSAAQRWDLALGRPFPRGSASWTAPGHPRSGPWAGMDVVLKVSFPHAEAAPEADGLRLWHGQGAAELLDSSGWDLLLARCIPGTSLADDGRDDDQRLGDAARALRALHDAGRLADPVHAHVRGTPLPGQFPDMGAVCRAWADTLDERHDGARRASAPVSLDSGLLRAGAGLLRELPAGAVPAVVHGDANPSNLLRDGGSWAWIDPKPMVGDPAYDPWPLLEQVGDPHSTPDPVVALRARTTRVAEILGLDAARIAAWAVARSTESALWAWAELGDPDAAARFQARARTWARLTG